MKKSSSSEDIQPTKRPKQPRSWSFRSLDLLGGSFMFVLPTVTGKFQTTIGSLMTLIVLCLSIGLFVVLYLKMLDTSDPVMTQSTEYSSESVKMDLFKELMVNPFRLQYGFGSILAKDFNKYLTIKGFVVDRSFVKEANQFKYSSIQSFGYKPCLEYKDKTIYKEYFDFSETGSLNNFLMCPDLEDSPALAEVSYNPSSLSSKDLYIKIFPCSLADRSQCQPRFFADLASLSIMTPLWTPQPGNYSDPLQFKSQGPSASLSSAVKRIFSYNIRRHRIVDALNEFKGERIREEYLMPTQTKVDEISRNRAIVYCPESDMTFFSKTCDDFLTLQNIALSEVITLRRNYKKLSELFGEFGGILKVGSILLIFYVIYNAKVKEMMLADKVFGLKKGKNNRVIPKRELPYSLAKPAEEKSLNLPSNQMKEMAIESVRECLSVNNFIKKMSFAKLLRYMLIDEKNKELLSIINLKQSIQEEQTEEEQSPINPFKEPIHKKDKNAENSKDLILKTQMKTLFDNCISQKARNLSLNQDQPLRARSCSKSILDDKEHELNNQGFKRLIPEPRMKNKHQNVSGGSENRIPVKTDQMKEFSNREYYDGSQGIKNRFKKGLKPYSIRVRQRNSKFGQSLQGKLNEKNLAQ